MARAKLLIRDPWPFVATWLVTALLAVYLPRRHWHQEKQVYYESYGYAVEYEQAQRAYDEAQRAVNGDDRNNKDDDVYNNYPSCHWYDWTCRKTAFYYQQNSNNNNNGQNNNNNEQVPYWYIFIGGHTEEERRDMEEQGITTTSGALQFVHWWTMLLFTVIVVYGVLVLTHRNSTGASSGGMALILFLFVQFLLLQILMLGQGVILTDGRAMNDSVYGWYGQTGVLMAYTNFWLLLYGIVFMTAFAIRMIWQRRQTKQQKMIIVDENLHSCHSDNVYYQKYDDEPQQHAIASAHAA